MKSNRILFLDYARVITAFLVVYGHLYEETSVVRLYIYAFHMPLFFLISGFLHSPRITIDEIKKYFRTLFVPILFFILIGLLIESLLYKQNILDLLYNTFKGVCIYGNSVPANGIVWFLFALMGVKLLMFVYLKALARPKKVYIIVSLFGVILLLYLCKRYHMYPFLIRHSLMAFPFYLLGFYIRKIYEKGHSHKLSSLYGIIGIFVFGLLCFLITRINGRVSMYGLSFGQANFPLNVILFYFNGIIGSLMIICVSLLIKYENRYITYTANALISILGFQEIIIKMIGYHGENYNYLISACVCVFVISGCLVLNQFFMTLCPVLLGKSDSFS